MSAQCMSLPAVEEKAPARVAEITRSTRPRASAEKCLAVVAISLMSLLPITEIIARQFQFHGIQGSTVFVQHLTLALAFIGAVLAAKSGRLLALSANTFLPEKWLHPVRSFTCAVGGAISLCLAWASLQFVLTQREAGFILAAGIPRWVAQSTMPIGFLAVAVCLVWSASPHVKWRVVAALGLLVPLALAAAPQLSGSVTLLAGTAVILIA